MPETIGDMHVDERATADAAGTDAAIPALRSPEAIVAALASTPGDLGRLLNEANADALTQPSQDGGAAVVEVVAHLRDWEAVVGFWVDRILSEGELPVLEVPDDSFWSIEHDYVAEDPHRAFSQFRDHRAGLLDCLGHLDAASWERRGMLRGEGERTVRQMLDDLATRDADHVRRAREALA